MKKVDFYKYLNERIAMEREANEACEKQHAITLNNLECTGQGEIELGVGWGSIGVVSPDEAEKFALALLKAARAARDFKYNGCKFDWGKKGEVLVEVR